MSEAHLPALNKLRDAINHFNEVFSRWKTAGCHFGPNFNRCWFFIKLLARPVHDEISSSWKDIMAALTRLLEEMTEGAAEVNKYLIKP